MLSPKTPETKPVKLSVKDVAFSYGEKKILDALTLDIHAERVTAIIGPSGCGKSTFLKCFNRIHEVTTAVKVSGDMLIDGVDIYKGGIDEIDLRRRVGMVFQKPNPDRKSVV